MPAMVVFTTAPDAGLAKKLARGLVLKRLAACVSLRGGFLSVYRWEGKVESSREALLLIKTVRKNFSKVKSFIESHHPYKLPEIVGVPVTQGSRKYLDWVVKSTR
jgi:periplasmic divalent cation tolerance protein